MNSVENFEEKLKKAEEILSNLNKDEITLEQSVKLVKEGQKLLNEAQAILENAKLSITEVTND